MASLEDIPAEVRLQSYNMYIPQKHAPTQEDLGNAVLFLASDFSRAITGTSLHVDGGTMAAAGFLDWPFGDGFMPAPPAQTLRRLFGVD